MAQFPRHPNHQVVRDYRCLKAAPPLLSTYPLDNRRALHTGIAPDQERWVLCTTIEDDYALGPIEAIDDRNDYVTV